MELHRLNGAVFAERDDWLLPAHFGDPAGEYTAARSSAGLVDLSRRGLLQCTGPDRLSFLQGMLSNDLRALQPFYGPIRDDFNPARKSRCRRPGSLRDEFFLPRFLGEPES